MRPRASVVAGAVALVLAGCGAPGGEAAGGGVAGTVTVFAAASLTASFDRIGRDFEAAHPGSTVVFNFAGSSALATQITEGAPADVFASAAPQHLAAVTTADGVNGAAGTPAVFVRNQLVIAVAAGNPEGVRSLSDLTRPGLKVALCAEQVPCGSAARRALDAAGVTLTPVTLEADVRGALAKVRLGEVDAALVYRTDTRAAAPDVTAVEFPESAQAVNDYPIAVLADAPNPTAAHAFVAHVRSAQSQAVLTEAGFQAP
ncbi:molybdate ABC transporter substrate-binding protein [Salinispora cortesiana]|uniref:molybdate ABC transporter substrate-binding protein n=1 Tax=Salinispora cortesiana TaxID=1305843 RepID=UPI000400E69D|nr:molybdate ABC transporter substrate-binding protein [Salinispora cortesiana]